MHCTAKNLIVAAMFVLMTSPTFAQELDASPTDIGAPEEECSFVGILRDKILFEKRDAGFVPSSWRTAGLPMSAEQRAYYETRIHALEAKIPAAKEKCREQDAEYRAHTAKKEAELARQNSLPGVKLGMTTKQVLRRTSWGKPESVNRTLTAAGTSEQWVYGDGQYLYFTNGKLTAIQD